MGNSQDFRKILWISHKNPVTWPYKVTSWANEKGGRGVFTWYTGLNFNCTAALALHGLQFSSKLYTNVWDVILCRCVAYPSISEAVTLPMKFCLVFFYSGQSATFSFIYSHNWWRDLYSGDIAALLASGWSVKKVALVNFFSACTALLGLYIGIPVSTALDAESWILGAAMGMFLYVGLANIVSSIISFHIFKNWTKY